MPPPVVAIVAGEASGEMYGAELGAALRRLVPGLELFGIGGDRMQAEGIELVAHIRELAVVGITEVVAHLPRIYGIFRRMATELARRRPALFIPIDFPDFNLRLARKAKSLGIPVTYFIAPQVWAWRKSRLATMRRYVDRILCIFPFEEASFRAAGLSVSYVGHPLVESARAEISRETLLARYGLLPNRTTLCLLPGSRVREIENHLPLMLAAVKQLAAKQPLQAAIARAPTIERTLLDRILREHPVAAAQVVVLEQETYAGLGHADAAIVASGTATIEAALLGTPLVVVYRVSWPTWWLGKVLVDTPFYSMVNLIADRAVVPELIQDDFTVENVTRELGALLASEERKQSMRAGLAAVKAKLGEPGAIGRAARLIADQLSAGRAGIEATRAIV